MGLGGPTYFILRVRKALGCAILCILYAARGPADPVHFYSYFSLRRLVPAPRSSPRTRAFGARGLILSRIGILCRIDMLIPDCSASPELFEQIDAIGGGGGEEENMGEPTF